MSQRKKWSAAKKFEIVLQVLKNESTMNEICSRYQVAPAQVSSWTKRFLEQGLQKTTKPNEQQHKTLSANKVNYLKKLVS